MCYSWSNPRIAKHLFVKTYNTNLSSYPKISFLRTLNKKKIHECSSYIHNIFSVTMYLHIYLWKHVVLVDEWKDEYVGAYMNITSIYLFTFECK